LSTSRASLCFASEDFGTEKEGSGSPPEADVGSGIKELLNGRATGRPPLGSLYTARISPGYCATNESAVRSVMPSTVA